MHIIVIPAIFLAHITGVVFAIVIVVAQDVLHIPARVIRGCNHVELPMVFAQVEFRGVVVDLEVYEIPEGRSTFSPCRRCYTLDVALAPVLAEATADSRDAVSVDRNAILVLNEPTVDVDSSCPSLLTHQEIDKQKRRVDKARYVHLI